MNQFVSHSLRQATGRVLVIGAGHIDHKKYIKNEDTEIVQVDLEHFGPHIAALANAEGLPFIDKSFDAIFMFEVLEHIADVDLALGEIHRTLKESGILWASVPFLFHIHADPEDYRRYTLRGWQTKLKNFSSLTVTPFGSRVDVILDLISSGHKILVPLRIFNYVCILWPLSFPTSHRSPSGYFIKCVR